jgi:hypothetical protein
MCAFAERTALDSSPASRKFKNLGRTTYPLFFITTTTLATCGLGSGAFPTPGINDVYGHIIYFVLRPLGADDVPIRPDELDRHRYTHCFKGPCCLCTYIRGDELFCEAKIGLAQTVDQPATAHCLGRYVAICPTQECGYFGMSRHL